MLQRRQLFALLGPVAGAMLGHSAHAQSTPVRILVGAPAGGSTDTLARALATEMGRLLGRVVVVENRAGAGGNIAADAVAKAAPDGNTLLMSFTSHAINASLYPSLPFDPIKDFTPLTCVATSPSVLVAHPSLPVKDVRELIALAKANPGKLNYGSWSVGNPVHLGSEMFAAATGTQMQHAVFKETTQLYTSVSTGEIDFALGSAATAGPLYRAGKLRFLAITAPQRWPAYPDVPTVGESGGPKGFEVTGWNVLAVPPGLPPATADKIRRDVAQALAAPDVQEKFKSFGYTSFPVTPEQFQQFQKGETQRFAEVIRQANVSLD